jgi:ribosomal protein L21
MRRAARLAAALARGAACAGEGVAAWRAGAPSCAPSSGLAAAAAHASALHAGAPRTLLPPAAAASASVAAAGRPALPCTAVRLLRTSAAAPSAAPEAAADVAALDASEPAPWRLVGRVEQPFTLKPKDAFAVVQAGPHQFKVTIDDLIYVEKMHGVDINDKARDAAWLPALPAGRCAQAHAHAKPCRHTHAMRSHAELLRQHGARSLPLFTLTFSRASCVTAEQVSLPRVLMVGSTARTVLGRPFVPSAEVLVVVEEQVRDAKVIIFKKRRRKNSRRTNGHRQARVLRGRFCVVTHTHTRGLAHRALTQLLPLAACAATDGAARAGHHRGRALMRGGWLACVPLRTRTEGVRARALLRCQCPRA